nr:MAG TPA: hypothetical protein [Caudoviricetes sp.]
MCLFCSPFFLLFVLVLSFCVCVRWWRVAASARRAPPPSNTTLCSFSSSFFFFVPRLSFLLLL